MADVITVEHLTVAFPAKEGTGEVVRDVSLAIGAGERVGLVGESGSGKSLTARAIMRLIPAPGRVTEGTVCFDGTELGAKSAPTKWRGTKIAMITQDPLSSLNPLVKIGTQITEMLRYHRGLRRAEAKARAQELLRSVGIPDPRRTMTRYPAVLSGGMRQRVALAIAISCDPRLLIADEPTTALDVTVQAQVLTLLERMTAEHGSAVLLISHDLGVVGNFCDRLLVMYAGRIVESGPTAAVIGGPAHPYTRALIASIPSLRGELPDRLASIAGSPPHGGAQAAGCAFAPRCPMAREVCPADRSGPAENPIAPNGPGRLPSGRLSRPRRRKLESGRMMTDPAHLHGATTERQPPSPAAATDPDRLPARQPGRPSTSATCGCTSRCTADWSAARSSRRSTASRSRSRPARPSGLRASPAPASPPSPAPWSASTARPAGRSCSTGPRPPGSAGSELRAYRRRMQMVYQDPYDSLDPKMTIKDAIGEGLTVRGVPRARRTAEVEELLARVNLPVALAGRYPGQLSGGQRQRVSIARALAVSPEVIVCDEAVAALDVSIRAQVLNLLKDIQADAGVSYLFISHDLSTLRFMADHIAIMYVGRLVEHGTSEQVFGQPAHPYTQALMAAVPDIVNLGGPRPAPLRASRRTRPARRRAAPSTPAARSPSRSAGRSRRRSCARRPASLPPVMSYPTRRR